jgi:hypothetical protein
VLLSFGRTEADQQRFGAFAQACAATANTRQRAGVSPISEKLNGIREFVLSLAG